MTKQEKYKLFFDVLAQDKPALNYTQVSKKHFKDSIAPIKILDKLHLLSKSERLNLVDVGAGVGFPTIPLAIERQNFYMTACDSSKKSIDNLKKTVEILNLQNVTPINLSAQNLAKQITKKFDASLCRAVGDIKTVLSLQAPLVREGGLVICFAGLNYKQEIRNAKHTATHLELSVKQIYEYELDIEENLNNPNFAKKRAIIVYQKQTKNQI
ncbi:MAG: class I SAM-dependent methyltransferase [Firmicutes bacterium]|nr:class I SAM-dependent methyltransferase [Bacillota bacterium]